MCHHIENYIWLYICLFSANVVVQAKSGATNPDGHKSLAEDEIDVAGCTDTNTKEVLIGGDTEDNRWANSLKHL